MTYLYEYDLLHLIVERTPINLALVIVAVARSDDILVRANDYLTNNRFPKLFHDLPPYAKYAFAESEYLINSRISALKASSVDAFKRL